MTPRRTPLTPSKSERRASALLAVIAISAVIATTVTAMIALAGDQRLQLTRLEIRQRETATAEHAVDFLVSRILYTGRYRPDGLAGGFIPFHEKVTDDMTLADDTFPGFELSNVSVVSVTGDTPTFAVINDPADPFNGGSLLRMEYRVTASARETTEGNASRLAHPGVQITRTVRVNIIPLYQYAIFYGNTLEIDAGVQMDIIGKVHTNGNMYMTTSSRTNYWRPVTVAGQYFSGMYAPATGRTGSGQAVYVTNSGEGSYPGDQMSITQVYQDGQWIDSRRSNWAELANSYFKDSVNDVVPNLRDQALGAQPILLPLPPDTNPHVIIEPPVAGDPPAIASQKFGNSAAFRITGNPATPTSIQVRDSAGNLIPANRITFVDPVGGQTKSWVSTNFFYNGREEKRINTIDINAGNMKRAAELGLINLGNAMVYVNPTQPSNPTQAQSAARLINAAVLPVDAYNSFTFASSAPVYTKGDVNTASGNARALALIAGDSINIQTSAFTESSYPPPASFPTTSNGPKLDGNPVTTNAIFMGGNTPSDDPAYAGRYSGGAENFFRYLESLGTDDPHTFNGSIMNLWKSQIATKSWDKDPTPGTQSSGYYDAPRRVWSWDIGMQTRIPPPQFPTFWQFQTLNWEIQQAGFTQ